MEMVQESVGEVEETQSLKGRRRRGNMVNTGANGGSGAGEEVQTCVSYEQNQGTQSQSLDEITEEYLNGVGLLDGEKRLGNDETGSENQNGLLVVPNNRSVNNGDNESKSTLLPKSSEGHNGNGPAKSESFKGRDGANVNSRQEDAEKVIQEIDVERVLEEQDTHDLYCPNCNSCITKRVILRKRKRIARNPQVDAKQEKTQQPLVPELEATSDAAEAFGRDQGPPSHDNEPDVFRCLSCFSFFIPTGNGLKLFPIFGRSNEDESLQSPQQADTKNLNCISSIIEFFRGKQTGNKPANDLIHSDQEEIVQPLLPLQGLNNRETLLPGNANTASSINNEGYLSGESFDAVRSCTQDKQSSLVLLAPGSSLLQETKIGSGEKVGSQVEENSAGDKLGIKYASKINGTSSLTQVPENLHVSGRKKVEEDLQQITLKDELSFLGSSKRETLIFEEAQVVSAKNITSEPKEHGGEDIAVQNGSVKVNSMTPRCVDSTLTVGKVSIPLTPSAQFPQDININSSYKVNDPESEPVEAPKNISNSETMQIIEKKDSDLLKLSSYSGKIQPAEGSDTNLTIKNIDNVDSFQANMDNLEPKLMEDTNAYLTTMKRGSLVTGNSKVDAEKILKDTANTSGAVIKPNTREIWEDIPTYDMAVASLSHANPVIPSASQLKGEVPAIGAPAVVPETRIEMGNQRMVQANARGWDILKSIVYGGLIESIISVGVVSSAAGSNTSTLNIISLGVANLISGLLVLVHDLRKLKNDQSGPINQGGKPDRYEATLGQRGHFRLHATVALLSYILFGLLPPIVYGLWFRKSDNKEYKLIAVAATSLLCIFLLATGKAHVRDPPKGYIKTIFYYISIVVMASGLSYVAGELLIQLLEKLGFHSSSVTPVSSNLRFREMHTTKSGWAAY